ncbi:MAG: Crp/Fnr family transcriptional regulator [Spirochaetales bacterium]|jgi:CRP/FNR family transcriptional regulator
MEKANDDMAMARFLELFPNLLPKEEWPWKKANRALESLRFRSIEAGATILREGQVCGSVPFVLEGVLRIFKTAESGREITLYRIEAGQSCILSAGCATGTGSFPASAVAEVASTAAFMPNETVRTLYAESAGFRDFMLAQYSSRMAEVIELVEEVAFRRVDERLHQWLLEVAGASSPPSGPMVATHQELADHMGTSREVISRILKDWEQRGFVEIARGSLRLLPGFEKLKI